MADEMEHTESELWTSPAQDPASEIPPRTPKTPKTPTPGDRQSQPVDREEALRRELRGVRKINDSIEEILATLERTNGNMEVVSKTVGNASTLLNTWTRILSQTEHNQRLVLHPSWKGATEDLAEQEAEILERQRAAERKAAEEEQRREELRRRREEEEEKRRLGPTTSSRGTRGASRTRGTSTRGTTSSRGAGSLYRSDSRSGTATSRGSIPGTGRGLGTTRGRPRPPR